MMKKIILLLACMHGAVFAGGGGSKHKVVPASRYRALPSYTTTGASASRPSRGAGRRVVPVDEASEAAPAYAPAPVPTGGRSMRHNVGAVSMAHQKPALPGEIEETPAKPPTSLKDMKAKGISPAEYRAETAKKEKELGEKLEKTKIEIGVLERRIKEIEDLREKKQAELAMTPDSKLIKRANLLGQLGRIEEEFSSKSEELHNASNNAVVYAKFLNDLQKKRLDVTSVLYSGIE